MTGMNRPIISEVGMVGGGRSVVLCASAEVRKNGQLTTAFGLIDLSVDLYTYYPSLV